MGPAHGTGQKCERKDPPGTAPWRGLLPRRLNLRLPLERLIVTVDVHGNTSAASIPLALDIAVRDGRIREGHHVMLLGVGGGFTWGSVFLRY